MIGAMYPAQRRHERARDVTANHQNTIVDAGVDVFVQRENGAES